MKKLSAALIIAGLLIAAYPLLDKAYSIYLQTKVIMEWDVGLDDADTPEDAADDYLELQAIFEDELSEEEEAGLADPVQPSAQPDSTTALPEQSSPQPAAMVTAGPEQSRDSSAQPAKSQQFKVIGKIRIEKINADIPIFEGATRANLRLGAGHIKGTTDFGGVGNAALAAHRSHTYGKMFNRLDELEVGDKIIIETADGSFEYTVYKTLVIEPNDLSVLNRNDKDRVLTLITCTPLYTATHRLIVHAVMRN